ncbi:MAG: hypothetical protein M3Y81_00085 [Chloroflexota bacterium]|nr:hypothetical protein [Chloroflexota bacterium]
MLLSSENDIRRYIIEELAAVRATNIASIESEIASGGGDLEVDSLQAASVIGGLEGKLHCRLPGIEDLEPKQMITVRKLTELVTKKLHGLQQ